MKDHFEEEIKAKSSGLKMVNLTKKFSSHDGTGEFTAVDGINLEIHSGELTTLLGPSGCGKTTTLRMVAGFESITSGSLLLGGESIESVPPNKRDMAMMFQSYALFPHMTVYNNIRYGLKIQKLPEKEIEDRTNKIIDLMQIRGMENRLPSKISGGQQQRVALARAVVIEPKVLLFDEPLSNLDAKLREYMRDELRSLQQRLGITSLYVTHDQSEAMAISDKVVLMNEGRIQQVGSPYELYNEPASLFVADFIGKSNFLPCHTASLSPEGPVASILGENFLLKAPGKAYKGVTGNMTAVIRPEAVKLVDPAEEKLSGIVRKVLFFGNFVEYEVQVKDRTLRIESYCPQEQKIYRVDDPVGIKFNLESIRLLESRERLNSMKGRYKLVVCDLDGTLVNEDKLISRKNRKAIEAFRKQGGEITFATGRIEKSVKKYARDLDVKVPMILYNGARIYHPGTGDTIRDLSLSAAEVHRAVDLMKHFPFDYIFYSAGEAYILKSTEAVRSYENGDGFQCVIDPDIEKISRLNITKILMIGDNSSFDDFRERFQADPECRANLVQSENTYLEILPSGVNKGNALEILAEHLGIPLEEVICFGDNLNDLEMILRAGVGVAMSNGREEVRDAADIVAPSNNEDGVGSVLLSLMEDPL